MGDRSIFYIAGIGIVNLFLLLWPLPWPGDLHIRTWPVYTPGTYIGCANMNFLPQGLRQLSSDRQTDKMDQNYKPRLLQRQNQLYNSVPSPHSPPQHDNV